MMFLDKKDDFYSVVNNYPYLSKAAKKDIISFLDQFFDQLEKPRSLDNLIDLFLEELQETVMFRLHKRHPAPQSFPYSLPCGS